VMADLAISFYEELIPTPAGVDFMAGEANIQLARCAVRCICWIWNRITIQHVVLIGIMADLAISFYEELIRARAGVDCMTGEANIELARVAVRCSCRIWNHTAIQPVVYI
jgi:hypothetical protein